MDRKKLNGIISLIINVLVIVGVTWSVAYYFYHEDGAGNMLAHGPECFRFFTIDSIILAALTCAIYMYFNIMAIRGKKYDIPLWLKIFRYVAAVAVGVTFFVVLLVLAPLAPVQGYSPLYVYEDNCIILHGLAPLFVMFSVVVLEREDHFERKYMYYSFSTVGIYGTVYFICVLIAKIWDDFYYFTFGGKNYLAPVSALMVLGLAWGVMELMYFLQKLCVDKLPKLKEEQWQQ